jgi:hypothetical protein
MGSGDYPTPWIRGNDQQWALSEKDTDASPPPPGGLSHPDPDMTCAGKCGRWRRHDGNEKQRCDGMETRGRSGHVEKMGNEAMNCLAQDNKWKLALGRGGGRRRFTVQGVEIIFYLRHGPSLQ